MTARVAYQGTDRALVPLSGYSVTCDMPSR
jgi:hypothetical protein